MESLILNLDGYQIAERVLEGVNFPYHVQYDPESILEHGLLLEQNIRFIAQEFAESEKKFLKQHRFNEKELIQDMYNYISARDYEYAIETFWEMLGSPDIQSSQSLKAREEFLDEAMTKLYS